MPQQQTEPKVLAKQAAAVRDLLADEKRWLQSDLAENEDGITVSPFSRDACKFCLVGAIAHVVGSGPNGGAYDTAAESPIGRVIANTIRGIEGRGSFAEPTYVRPSTLHSYNDCRSHQEVMEVLHTTVAFTEGAAKAGVEF